MKLALILIMSLMLIVACKAKDTPEQTEDLGYEPPEVKSDFPNTGGGVVEMKETPKTPLTNGGLYDFSWSATGGSYISETTVQVSANSDFTEFDESAKMTNGPGIYQGTLTIQGEGTVYVRAYAMIDGNPYYSEVLPMEIMGAPANT